MGTVTSSNFSLASRSCGPAGYTGHPPKAARPVPKPAQYLPVNDVPEPEWLRQWLRLARLPVRSDAQGGSPTHHP